VQLGMSATVRVQEAAAQKGYAVPLSAVFQRHAEANREARVWVVNADGAAVTSHPVELGPPVGESEIIVYGLSPGQRIVTAGTSRLREGETIKVLDSSGLGASPVERQPTTMHSAQSANTATVPIAAQIATQKADLR